jgi:hypothetical protein
MGIKGLRNPPPPKKKCFNLNIVNLQFKFQKKLYKSSKTFKKKTDVRKNS